MSFKPNVLAKVVSTIQTVATTEGEPERAAFEIVVKAEFEGAITQKQIANFTKKINRVMAEVSNELGGRAGDEE